MLLPFTHKVVKRCSRGHVMDMAWRSCPACTGRAVQTAQARDIIDRTVIGSPSTVDHATRMVAASAPERAELSVVLRLEATEGPLSGESYPVLIGRVRLGKSPSVEGSATLMTLADPYMSRSHAAIEAGTGGAVLLDLGSTNGTFVNGARVERAILQNGDQVRMGRTTLRVTFVRRG
jgi:hypothetical protein